MAIEVGDQAARLHASRASTASRSPCPRIRGSKNVVLMFYPWAFTGVCTSELCEIRDRMTTFDNDDTVTFAVSCDSSFSLRILAEREGYTFHLLSDFWPHGESRGVRRLQREVRRCHPRHVHHRQGRRRPVHGRQRDSRCDATPPSTRRSCVAH